MNLLGAVITRRDWMGYRCDPLGVFSMDWWRGERLISWPPEPWTYVGELATMSGGLGGTGCVRGVRSLGLVPARASPRPKAPGRPRAVAATQRGTTAAERLLRKALSAAGVLGYRRDHPGVPGKPAVVFTRWLLAVFVDDASYNGHPDHISIEPSDRDHHDDTSQTQHQDFEVGLALSKAGFTALRFWDYEVTQDPAQCVREVERALAIAGRPRPR